MTPPLNAKNSALDGLSADISGWARSSARIDLRHNRAAEQFIRARIRAFGPGSVSSYSDTFRTVTRFYATAVLASECTSSKET